MTRASGVCRNRHSGKTSAAIELSFVFVRRRTFVTTASVSYESRSGWVSALARIADAGCGLLGHVPGDSADGVEHPAGQGRKVRLAQTPAAYSGHRAFGRRGVL